MSRKLAPATLAATAAFQQPEHRPGRFRPGERVRFVGGTSVFTVADFDGALYRLRSESGAELRAGWRTLERVEVSHG